MPFFDTAKYFLCQKKPIFNLFLSAVIRGAGGRKTAKRVDTHLTILPKYFIL
jgi:hypothetical protein